MKIWMNMAGNARQEKTANRPAMALTLAVVSLLVMAAPPVMAEEAKGSKAHIAAVTRKVDGAFIRANEARTNDWPSHGLDYAETRFSKLQQIHTANVKDLGLVWSYNLESTRGVEATPLVVDGVMYVSASWSIVHAIDVRSGKKIWTFDPKVPREAAYKGCCDVVNRGVALYQGKVFVASYDGRLIALDAATGNKVWKKTPSSTASSATRSPGRHACSRVR